MCCATSATVSRRHAARPRPYCAALSRSRYAHPAVTHKRMPIAVKDGIDLGTPLHLVRLQPAAKPYLRALSLIAGGALTARVVADATGAQQLMQCGVRGTFWPLDRLRTLTAVEERQQLALAAYTASRL